LKLETGLINPVNTSYLTSLRSSLFVVQENISLRAVDLTFNGFGGEGAVALGRALKENASLEELNVRYRPLVALVTGDGILLVVLTGDVLFLVQP